MINREKVIKGITHHKLGMCDMSGKICPYWNEDDGCSKKMLEDVLSLLKEQEAKKVTWRVGRAHCPSCGELFPKKQDKQYIRFCNYCGQAVKWNE